MQFRRLGRALEQLTVERQGLLVLPESHQRQRLKRPVVAVGGLEGEQPLDLSSRLEMQMAPGKNLRILETRQMVVRRQLEHPFQQQVRIVEHFALHADAREQAHRLDVITVPAQVSADELLGRRELAIGEEGGRGHDLRRQLPQRGDVLRRLRGLPVLARHPVEALEEAPARRHGRIDVDGAQEGVDRLRRLSQRDVAVPAFLVEAAEPRMQALELGERGESGRDITREALGHRAQIQDVTVLWHRDQQRLGRAQGRRELPLLQQLAYPLNLTLHHGSSPGARQTTRSCSRTRSRGPVAATASAR